MTQNIFVFGIAAIFVVIEALLRMGLSQGGWGRLMLFRGLALALLSAVCIGLLKLEWLSGPVAYAGLALLWAEGSLVSVHKSDSILAKCAAIFFALVVLGSVFAVMIFSGIIQSRWKPAPDLRVEDFEKIKMNVVSRIAVEKFAGAKAVIISSETIPFMTGEQVSQMVSSFTQSLAKGKIEILTVVNVPVAPDERGRQRYQFDAEWVDNLVDQHPDCHLVISFIGLPRNYGDMRSLRGEYSPSFILLNQFSRIDRNDFNRLLKEERIAASVRWRANWMATWNRNPVMASGEELAFRQRYVLATPENAK